MIAALFSVAIIGCKDDDGKNNAIEVDQTTFLENTSEIIASDYASFNVEVNKMSAAIEKIKSTSTLTELIEAQSALKRAYLAWQKVSMYEFGPAEGVTLKNNLNIFKTDTIKIESKIANADYNFDQFDIQDAIGFPALDYLLNSNSDNFFQLKSSANRCDYLKAVTRNLKSKVNSVANSWGSEFKITFISKKGTDVGSSTGMLINALNLHFEKYFRDNKIGIPLGIRSSGIARTDFIEAAYGNYSVELAKENFSAMKNLYLGAEGYGLDDYLIAVDAEELNQNIKTQLEIIEFKLNALSDPLQQQIDNNPQQVQEAYAAMQKLIVFWKVDLPSRMGVLITYQDNDGD